jgi:peptidyl-prolyl cis-trans isomerase D
VGPRRLQEAISSEEAFQVDGKYSETLALARLAQVGLTAEQYREDVRRGLQTEELQRAIFASEFLTPIELGRRLALEDEQREVRYAIFAPAAYRQAVRVANPELEAWYQQNSQRFLTEESVRLQFAEATETDLANQVVITEADLLDRYAEERDRYQLPERRRARHILVASEAEARQALAQLQGGADFADLAKRLSTDTGSAAAGGDLGLLERSAYVQPFADALFAMNKGEVRGPVKTEFGFHLIRLEEVEAGRARSFAEVRGELEEQQRRDRLAELFNDRQEAVQRRVEEPGVDFVTMANDLGLKLGEAANFARGRGSPELGAAADLEAVVFGDAVLNQRRIGGPIAVGDDRFVVVRVLEHRKPTVPPLADIRERVLQAYVDERAGAEARKAADSVIKLLGDGAAFENLSRGLGAQANPPRFIDRGDPSVPAEIRAAAFELARPASGSPSFKTVRMADGGAAVVMVSATRVLPGGVDVALRAARGQQLAVEQTRGLVAAYIEDARADADVTLNPQAFQ